MVESADWFGQKFSLTLCGHKFGASAAKQLVIVLAAIAIAAVVALVVTVAGAPPPAQPQPLPEPACCRRHPLLAAPLLAVPARQPLADGRKGRAGPLGAESSVLRLVPAI